MGSFLAAETSTATAVAVPVDVVSLVMMSLNYCSEFSSPRSSAPPLETPEFRAFQCTTLHKSRIFSWFFHYFVTCCNICLPTKVSCCKYAMLFELPFKCCSSGYCGAVKEELMCSWQSIWQSNPDSSIFYASRPDGREA